MEQLKGAKTFSTINIGDRASFKVLVDRAAQESFLELSGDNSPIHVDEGFCVQSKFGRRIGYAFYLTMLLSRLYGKYLPGGSSICVRQEANFIKPFFIDDWLNVVGVVTGKIESTHFVEIETSIYRRDNELIFRGKGIE
jgi:acyl dehydratase